MKFLPHILVAALMIPLHMHAIEAESTITASQTLPTEITTVRLINKNRVKRAQEVYTRRAAWAPFIKYSIMGTGIGLTLASIVAYYWTGNRVNSKLTFAEVKQVRELLANQQVNKEDKSINYEQSAIGIGLFLATGLAQVAGKITLDYGMYNIAGNLEWYIESRTAYLHNMLYLKQSCKFYAIFKESIPATAQLLVRDIEKILGYLAYCKEVTFAEKSADIKRALDNHSAYIEEHANALFNTINEGHSAEQLIARITLLEVDIEQAKKFIGVYS